MLNFNSHIKLTSFSVFLNTRIRALLREKKKISRLVVVSSGFQLETNRAIGISDQISHVINVDKMRFNKQINRIFQVYLC